MKHETWTLSFVIHGRSRSLTECINIGIYLVLSFCYAAQAGIYPEGSFFRFVALVTAIVWFLLAFGDWWRTRDGRVTLPEMSTEALRGLQMVVSKALEEHARRASGDGVQECAAAGGGVDGGDPPTGCEPSDSGDVLLRDVHGDSGIGGDGGTGPN